MKAFLKHIAFIVLVFWLIRLSSYALVGFSTYYTPWLEKRSFGHQDAWGHSYERMQDFRQWATRKTDKRRGIILGSSTAYRNIHTETLSKGTQVDWFNLGSSSQTPEIGYILLEMAAQKTSLSYLLLDIYIEVLDNSPEEAATDFVNNTALSFREKLRFFLLSPNPRLFDRLAYRTVKQWVPHRIIRVHSPSNGIYLPNGSSYSPLPSEGWAAMTIQEGVQTFIPNPKIDKILAFCRKNQISVIFNISPVLGKITANKTKYDPVILNDEFNNQFRLFYDDHHMHGEGAIQYSESLAVKMVNLTGLKDPHSAPAK